MLGMGQIHADSFHSCHRIKFYGPPVQMWTKICTAGHLTILRYWHRVACHDPREIDDGSPFEFNVRCMNFAKAPLGCEPSAHPYGACCTSVSATFQSKYALGFHSFPFAGI